MEADAAKDSEYEVSISKGESSDDGSLSGSDLPLPKNVYVETIHSPRSSPSKEFHNSKWLRLRKQHIPNYVNVFRDAWSENEDTQTTDPLNKSQLGAMTWLADEKDRFFTALGKYGRRDLRSLADAVETKSELEIKAYLKALQQAELERQLMHHHPRNVSGAEIPAAIEIGGDVENALEKAADALSAYQDQYDYAVASRTMKLDYIITSAIATQLDTTTSAKENASEDAAGDAEAPFIDQPHELFNVVTFVGLSESLFMRGTADQSMDNWVNLAEAGESPSLTHDALSDMAALVVSLTRRLVQAIIFVAQSRLRATASKHRKPSAFVRLEDVESALDILNIKQSLFDYWLRFPRRRGLAVVSGSHEKGARKNEPLDLEEVEDSLSKPQQYRGRHSRSTSRAAPSDRSESANTRSRPTSPDDMSLASEDARQSSDALAGDDIQSDSEPEYSEDDEEASNTPDGEETLPAPKSLSKRRRLLEEEQDSYMEELDQNLRRAEEKRLLRELELTGESPGVKDESEEPPRKRPKVMRKTVEDVDGWQVPYLAAWEAYDLRPPTEPASLSPEAEADVDASMASPTHSSGAGGDGGG